MYLADRVISLDHLILKAIIDYTKSHDCSLNIHDYATHVWFMYNKSTCTNVRMYVHVYTYECIHVCDIHICDWV